jgi:citrate lyase subunit beta/citryl-CoA lyase
VRVNALSTPWGKADVAALAALPASARPSAVALPKAETAHDIRALDDHMPDGVDIWPLIETPKGVLHVGEIAASSPFITTLVMGTSDLVKDLHARHVPSREPLLYSLSRVVLVARALGLAVLDGVHLDLEDEAGFAASCAQGRALGLDGKTLIHPKTIQTANAVFGSDAAEIAQAKKLVAAWQVRGNQSVIVVDGQLVENLHIIEAERLLALAAHIDLLEKDLSS